MRLFGNRMVGEAAEWEDLHGVMQPINGYAAGKNLLSMHQLTADDIYDYLLETDAARAALASPDCGIDLLPRRVLKAVMRQPSTRTGGSMTSAMYGLGGSADLLSGMGTSSEAKGESFADSCVALATEAQILGIRTAENYGPMMASEAISIAITNVTRSGREWPMVPVINLGDGKNEHPTQALGDLFTIRRRLGGLESKRLVMVGDHEEYRAFHSLMLGAMAVGMEIVTVESDAAPVPDRLVEDAGASLVLRTHDLDSAMRQADVLYMGRNPGEYTGKTRLDKKRHNKLTEDYEGWIVDADRIQQMKANSIVMHPRPRLAELDPSIDSDHRAADVEQMLNMKAMRMAIIARHLGFSIRQAVQANSRLQTPATYR